MANGASRLFEVMKNTGESTNNTPSQLVSLTIKSVSPLILVRDDRLEIPAEFCILHKSLNIDTFRINDVVTAIVLNNGQQYFIIYNNTAEEQGANYNDLSNKPKINDIELNGNKTSDDLGLLNKVINVVVANTDLDDYKEDGEFYFGVDYTPTNIPAGVNGWLKVITGEQQGYNIVKQIWYRHGTPNSNDYETYVRTFSGNIWSSWRRLITEKSQVAYGDWHSVILTRSDNNYLYIMLYGSNILKEGTYSIANNFKLVTYGSTYSELTIPKSALNAIYRRDWGFELVFNRSGISGIASGQYNGVAVPYDGTLLLQST